MNHYNLDYHKKLNKSHIIPNILQGAQSGVYSQFLSDIILSILLYNESILINDISISKHSKYYAATASGMLLSFLSIYMDPFACVLFSTVTYSYVYNLIESKNNNTSFVIKPIEIIFDSIVTIILLYCFDSVAHNQYLRYSQKRRYIEPSIERQNKTTGQTIFFIVLVGTYGFLKTKEAD